MEIIVTVIDGLKLYKKEQILIFNCSPRIFFLLILFKIFNFTLLIYFIRVKTYFKPK